MPNEFTTKSKEIIKRIPKGKVTTYGIIAAASGNYRGARQVARILHFASKKDGLPWHRVVNRMGRISLDESQGFSIQKALLCDEGVRFKTDGAIDLDAHLWFP